LLAAAPSRWIFGLAHLGLSLHTIVTAFLLATSILSSKYCNQMLKVSEFVGVYDSVPSVVVIARDIGRLQSEEE
jgi:hypothetical protein